MKIAAAILLLACGPDVPEVRFTLPEEPCVTTGLHNEGPGAALCDVAGRQVWVSADETEQIPRGAKWFCYSLTGGQVSAECQ